MKARLYLISIIIATSASLLTYGELDIFHETIVNILNKEIVLSSEIIISVIILLTLISVFIFGLIDKVFMVKETEKKTKQS
tara:strand:- start:593 stop:835 length:243 start_codon:yes stop_codon:yes gene_type:complete